MGEEIRFPIPTIPDISYRMSTIIIVEISDFSRFDSPDRILAYVGMSPSTCQSGQRLIYAMEQSGQPCSKAA